MDFCATSIGRGRRIGFAGRVDSDREEVGLDLGEYSALQEAVHAYVVELTELAAVRDRRQ